MRNELRAVASRIDTVNAELARYETIKRHFVADVPLTVEDGTLTSSLKLRRKIVYDRLRVMLRDKLGIAPSPAVQSVYRRLLGDATSTTP